MILFERNIHKRLFNIFDLDLQPPSIIVFNVTDNLMYLTVQPPPGSFDFYTVRCPEDEPWRIFSREVETVTCHIISKLPLMNIILETIKGSLQPAVSSITQEGTCHC